MAATTPTRRRRARASAIGSVAELKTVVDQLIKENRRLKRQVAKLESAGGRAVKSGPRSNPVTAGLAGMHRKIRRALEDSRAAAPRRRASRSAARPSATKRSTSSRTRRPASPETQRKRLEALAKARAARAAKKAMSGSVEAT